MEKSSWWVSKAFTPTDWCSWYWKVYSACYQGKKVNTNPATNPSINKSGCLCDMPMPQ